MTMDVYVDFDEFSGFGHLARSLKMLDYLNIEHGKVVHLKKIYFEMADNNIVTIQDATLSKYCILDSIYCSTSFVAELLHAYDKVVMLDDWLFRGIDHSRLGVIDWTIGNDCLMNANHRKFLKKSAVFEGESFAPLIETCRKNEMRSNCFVYLGGGVSFEALDLINLIRESSHIANITIVGNVLDVDHLDDGVSCIAKVSDSEFASLLCQAELFICCGGWAMYEALGQGVAVGLIFRSGNSVYDILGAINKGYGFYLGVLSGAALELIPHLPCDALTNKLYTKWDFSQQLESRKKVLEWLQI